jgi:hypothetical protein
MPAPSEKKKRDDEQDSFWETLELVIDQIPRCHIQILFFSDKVRRENIFKPKIGNESLHETTNGNSEIL